MEVQVIDSEIKQRQLNVCAYARVSTNKDEQEAAIETQIDYYSELILSNPEWNYCGIYADEGITGTSMAKRVQFNKMIELALSGKIDIILCKSISRFARNTIDFKETIQKLTEANCEVIFEKENISSKDPKIEIFSSTLASIAQEESRSISENVKWGLKRKYQNNEFWINENQLIGYKYDENHKVVIDKSQEEIIRIIFEEYAKKTSVFRISKMLEKKGFLTPNKNHKWSASTIRSILRNQKYIGTVILQKKFVKSYKEKEVRIKNTGQKPMYVLEDAIPAIIDKELFDKVQSLIKERREQFQIKSKASGDKFEKNKNYPLTGMVLCAKCHKHYYVKRNNPGKAWERFMLYCGSNRSTTTCPGESYFEDIVEQAMVNAFNDLIRMKPILKEKLIQSYSYSQDYLMAKESIEKSQVEINDYKAKMESYQGDSDFSIELKKEVQHNIDVINTKVAIERNNLSTLLSPENRAIKFLKDMDGIKVNVKKISDFNYRKLFSKIIAVNKDEIHILIGERTDYPNYDIKSTALLEGSIDYIVRITDHKLRYKVIIF